MNSRMAHALRHGLVAPESIGSDGENPRVSAVSRFDDDVWDFSNEDGNPARADRKICWSFRTSQGTLFTDPQFQSLLIGFKQLIYALRWHPIDSAPFGVSALCSLFRLGKLFVDHLLAYPMPVLRFKDVLPHHCEDYIEEVLNCGLSASYKYHRINILQKLFLYRQVMKDGLVIEPLKGESAHKMAGYTRASELESQTQIIPDEILTPLVRAALEYVDRFADYLLDACEGVEDIRERQRWFGVWARRYVHKHASAAYGLDGSKFENGLRSLRHLNQELCYLQTACFVLIAFMTGMRISELLALREGCCEIETEPGHADLVWLRSRVFKMQGVPNGRSAKWLGGPICARAVRVLERLGQRVWLRVGISSLWMPRPKRPVWARTMRVRLNHVVKMLGLNDSSGRPFHIHPHMFHRTFARHVVRYDTTNLLALKEHFKHISLSMTDYYVGSDLELWTLMMEEEEKLLLRVSTRPCGRTAWRGLAASG